MLFLAEEQPSDLRSLLEDEFVLNNLLPARRDEKHYNMRKVRLLSNSVAVFQVDGHHNYSRVIGFYFRTMCTMLNMRNATLCTQCATKYFLSSLELLELLIVMWLR